LRDDRYAIAPLMNSNIAAIAKDDHVGINRVRRTTDTTFLILVHVGCPAGLWGAGIDLVLFVFVGIFLFEE